MSLYPTPSVSVPNLSLPACLPGSHQRPHLHSETNYKESEQGLWALPVPAARKQAGVEEGLGPEKVNGKGGLT